MTISPDNMVLFELGPISLNATVVTTWVLMAVLVVTAWLVTRRLSTQAQMSRWQNLLEVLVAGMRDQISAVSQPSERYLYSS
jgi:F-type H+-transporting ATPase subunit a